MIGKRINYDYPPRIHTGDDLRYGEDIIIREGRIEEAPLGTALTSLNYPDLRILGSLNIANDVVIFARSEKIVDEEILVSTPVVYYKRAENLLCEIIGDSSAKLNLGFNKVATISSAYRINQDSEIEIVFTDGVQKPYYINIGTREAPTLSKYQTTLDDVLLFPEERYDATIKATITNKGNLPEGAYFLSYRYFYNDGKKGAFNGLSAPYIVNEGGSLIINLTQADTSLIPFDGIEIYVLKDGEVKRIYQEQLNSNSIIYEYKEYEGTTISIDELTVQQTVYDRIGTFGVVDNRLVAGDVSLPSFNKPNLQSYINNCKVEITNKLVMISDKKDYRTFRAGEVYCLYLQPQFINGEFGDAYHIPNTNTNSTTKQYKEDAIYPLTGDFPTGNVMNHELPNEQDIYQAIKVNSPHWEVPEGMDEKQYSIKYDYSLGFRVTLPDNIPQEILDSVKIWRLLYAKKDLSNSRVIDEYQATFAAEAFSGRISESATSSYGLTSSGGNNQYDNPFNVLRYSEDQKKYIKDYSIIGRFKLKADALRLHSAETILNRYKLPEGLQLVLGCEMINRTRDVFVHDALAPFPNDSDSSDTLKVEDHPSFADYTFWDYLTHGKLSNVQPFTTVNVKDYDYALSGTVTDTNNQVAESCLTTSVNNKILSKWIEDGQLDIIMKEDAMYIGSEGATLKVRNNIGSDEDYADVMAKAWLISPSGNKHAYFWNDTPIPTSAKSKKEGVLTILETELEYDGDTYIGVYTEFYSGAFSAARLGNEGRLSPSSAAEGAYLLDSGVKAFRKIPMKSRLALSSRKQDVPESIFKGEIEENKGALHQFMKLRDTRNSQRIQINGALSKLNTYESITVHYDNVFDKESTNFPFRIHASQALQWRNFPPLQTQDIGIEFGKIMNISTWGDKTIIHQEQALWMTRDKVTLKTDEVSTYVGTSEFLGVTPQQIMPMTLDVGLDHKRKFILTKLGYFFVSPTNKVFRLSDKLEEISAYGMRYLFRDELIPNPHTALEDNIRIGYNSKDERIFVTILAPNTARKTIRELNDTTADITEVGDIVEYLGDVYKVKDIQ